MMKAATPPRHRIAAVLALLGATCSILPASARASGACVAFSRNGESTSKVDDDYIRLLSTYFDHHGSATPLMSGLNAKRIREHVFAHADSERDKYEAELRYLDKYSRVSPIASYELARRLQLHWESEYGVSTLRIRNESKDTGTWSGGILGLAVYGALIWKSPQSAPRYFRLIRGLLPLGGLAGGRAAGDSYAALLNNDRVPPSPAHFLRLGASEALDDQVFTNNDLYQDAIATAASVLASSAFASAWTAVDGAIVLASAPVPAKVNPYVLVGSLVAGAAAYGIARPSLELYEKHTLVSELRVKAKALAVAMRSSDAYARFDAADAFVASTLRLSAYLNLPVAQAIAEYAEKEARVGESYGSQPERLRAELARIGRERDETLRSIAPFAVGQLHSSLEGYMVSQALATGGTVDGIGSRARASLAAHRQAQDRYVIEQGAAYGTDDVCVEGDGEKALEYAHSVRSRLIRELASGIAAGTIPEDPLLLQLSAAAYLENFGNGELVDFANTLFAQVEHGLLQRRLLQPNGG